MRGCKPFFALIQNLRHVLLRRNLKPAAHHLIQALPRLEILIRLIDSVDLDET